MGCLLAMEDENYRISFRTFLEGEGYECVEAENGARAIGLLLTRHIDIVITDLDLPVISGIQLLGYMDEQDLLRNTPVIVIASQPDSKVKALARQAGAYATIAKPNNLQELHTVVSQAQRESVMISV